VPELIDQVEQAWSGAVLIDVLCGDTADDDGSPVRFQTRLPAWTLVLGGALVLVDQSAEDPRRMICWRRDAGRAGEAGDLVGLVDGRSGGPGEWGMQAIAREDQSACGGGAETFKTEGRSSSTTEDSGTD
jgi:hypothetical protein